MEIVNEPFVCWEQGDRDGRPRIEEIEWRFHNNRRHSQTLRCSVYEEQPFFKVLEPQGREMLAVEDLVERYAEVRRDAPGWRLWLRGRRMNEAVG